MGLIVFTGVVSIYEIGLQVNNCREHWQWYWPAQTPQTVVEACIIFFKGHPIIIIIIINLP